MAGEFVTRDGTRLLVRGTGPKEAPVTVMLAHAWTQDHTEWDPILPWLPREVRVLRYDHRGHGGSEPAKPGTATVAQLADDLMELITALAPTGRLVLAGHSMGGMTLMALAERYPEVVAERVAGVSFIATSCNSLDRLTLGLDGLAGRVAARADRALGRTLARYGKQGLPLHPGLVAPVVRWLAFGERAARTDVRALAQQFVRAHPNSIAGFRDSISRHNRRAALATLRGKPAVIMVGDRDRITPLSHARVIAEELPDAELVCYPGAGHELTYERARPVAQRLTALVRRALAAGAAAGTPPQSRARPVSR